MLQSSFAISLSVLPKLYQATIDVIFVIYPLMHKNCTFMYSRR